MGMLFNCKQTADISEKNLLSLIFSRPRVARFPKKPDFMLTNGDESQRQTQLQDYLNTILQSHEYRVHPETVSS